MPPSELDSPSQSVGGCCSASTLHTHPRPHRFHPRALERGAPAGGPALTVHRRGCCCDVYHTQRLAKKQERFKQLQLEEEQARRDVAQQRQAREAAEAAGVVVGAVGAREKLELDYGDMDRDFSVAEIQLDDELELKADG